MDELFAIARAALSSGEERVALAKIDNAISGKGDDPQLLQWKALLHRSLDEHPSAVSAISSAHRLAPTNASIAQGYAQVALEAGLPAEQLFEQAWRLAPGKPDIMIGLCAAHVAAGNAPQAVAVLQQVLKQSPQWIAGHQQLARIFALTGASEQIIASFNAALTLRPSDVALRRALVATLIDMRQYTAARDMVNDVPVDVSANSLNDLHAAILTELREDERADAMFARLPIGNGNNSDLFRARHLLRVGRIDVLHKLLNGWLRPENPLFWPYAAIVWRMMEDSRHDWLEGQESLISIIDLTDRLPPLEQLATCLRSLHERGGEMPEQSVRGGTQTDGMLFRRTEPEIQQVREAVSDAVRQHIAGLADMEPTHPTLRWRRDRAVRFAGSWSVRLGASGRHSNHVHPHGWLSSALYVSLPEKRTNQPDDAGWLTLGEPQRSLGIELTSLRKIEPRSGRLVLFPSTMWHGTLPFAEGERMTIAFDIAPPR